jgi:class 3 adenylate cyclase
MDNINDYISRISHLADRNKELHEKLKQLVDHYSFIQDQNSKYLELLKRFSTQQVTEEETHKKSKTPKSFKKLRMVSLLYVSISGFEQLHTRPNPSELIDLLDELFFSIDRIAEEYGVNKIKSFGDNIIYAGGLDVENHTNPIDITLAAGQMQSAVDQLHLKHPSSSLWKLKMGIHTGPVLASSSDNKPSPFSMSGESINIACRLGEACPPAQINISELSYELVKEFFKISPLGKMPVKYKGELRMFLVNGLLDELHPKEQPYTKNERFSIRYGHIQFMDIEEQVLNLLEKKLPKNLYYHNVKHTVDVVTEVELIGWAEKLNDEQILLLKLAALFHDTGHINDYKDHEYQSTLLAREALQNYKFSNDQIETVCRLIMATKLPPSPSDLMEEIICDSDLDYLGRTDFIPVSNNLFQELKERQMVNSLNDWNQMQLSFIGKHQYFTKTAQTLREVNKQQQIERIEQLLKQTSSIEK